MAFLSSVVNQIDSETEWICRLISRDPVVSCCGLFKRQRPDKDPGRYREEPVSEKSLICCFKYERHTDSTALWSGTQYVLNVRTKTLQHICFLKHFFTLLDIMYKAEVFP